MHVGTWNDYHQILSAQKARAKNLDAAPRDQTGICKFEHDCNMTVRNAHFTHFAAISLILLLLLADLVVGEFECTGNAKLRRFIGFA